MDSMKGQRVVVIGGTSGMGLATVRAAAALGAEVVSAGRRPLAQRASVPGV
jgi:NAD(P)-dependent dehydrogenase (short-subunit alcohol dehydrogenase family)